MTTSFLCSTRRLAFSITISATWTCRCAGSSNVDEMTSPLTERCMSVTSSGRSSMSSTMRMTSGWFAVIEFAIVCNSMVLPVRGGATIRPRFENTFTENEAALFSLRLQDLENQFLLPHTGSSLNVEVFGNLRQRGNVHFLELGNVHGGGAFWAIRSNEFF